MKQVIVMSTVLVLLAACAAPVLAPAETTAEQVKEQVAGKSCQRRYEAPCRISGRDAVCVTTTDVKFIRIGDSVYATDMEVRAPNGNVIFKELAGHIVTVPPESGGRLSFNDRNWIYRLRLAQQGSTVHLLGDLSKGGERYDADFECPPTHRAATD